MALVGSLLRRAALSARLAPTLPMSAATPSASTFPGAGELLGHRSASLGCLAAPLQRGRGFAAEAAVASGAEGEDRFPLIKALWRSGSGTKSSKALRKNGMLPGALQGMPNNENRWLVLGKQAMTKMVTSIGKTKFCSKAFTLEVRETMDNDAPAETFHVVPRLVHRTASNDALENIVFFAVPRGAPVKVDVFVEVIGDDVSPGVKKGGFPFLLMRTVPLICPSDDIPPVVEVDVSALDSEGRVLLEDIQIPANCSISAKNQHVPVVKIKGKARQLQPDST